VDENTKRLAVALRAIASMCDGAENLDKLGFNKADSRFGTQVALIPEDRWTPAICYQVWLMLAKYSKQLKTVGIDYDSLVPPSRTFSEASTDVDNLVLNRRKNGRNNISYTPDGFAIECEYEEQLITEIKTIPGVTWIPSASLWIAPKSASVEVANFAEIYNFSIDENSKSELPEPMITQTTYTLTVNKNGQAVLKFPFYPDSLVDVKKLPGRVWNPKPKHWTAILCLQTLDFADKWGLTVDDDIRTQVVEDAKKSALLLERSSSTDADIEIPSLNGKLMPYQRAGVQYVSTVGGRCLIADQMGLGKTVEAIAALEHLDAFPAIIVCPASLKENWKREINKWLPHRTVNVVDGKGAIMSVDVNVVNYDIVSRFVEPLRHLKPMGLVLDESHYVKTGKTKRTVAVKDIAKAVPRSGTVLLLSGTPITNRPEELVSQLEILGTISKFGGKWTFLKRYAGAHHNGFGWDTKGASNLQELNVKLRQVCYLRRTKDEVLTELPPKTRSVIHVEPSGKGYTDYKKAEKDLIAFLKENGYRGSDSAEHLRRTGVLKRLAADAKMDAVTEWIDSFLESCDRKLIVFAHHVAIVDALAAKYGGLRVSGRDSLADRQIAVDKFQNDPEYRVIVLNLQAGGVGLTLTAASDVCFVEQGWTPGEHDQAEDRAHRLGQKGNVQAWYLLGANTIDEDIYDLVDAKRSVVDAVTEGDEAVQQSVIGDLMKRFYSKSQP
jgi:superfamily II DNA or RNA helicase